MAGTTSAVRPLAVLALVALLLLGASASGCYYVRLGVGQARIIFGREDIADVLANPDLPAERRAKLHLVREVKAFAETELGLAETDNYTTFYDTGDGPASWNLSACPPDRFEPYRWSFPIVGEAPYKGFFNAEDAREEEQELRKLGYDTVLYGASAFSTLGWFSDPIFSRMLEYDDDDLADLIIHELTHATVFKKGDIPFNESVATFVGGRGALAFLEKKYGRGSEEVRRTIAAKEDAVVFAAFIDDLYGRLDRLYKSAETSAEKRLRREDIFSLAKREFAESVRPKLKTGAYLGFERRRLNNAVILGFRRYHTDLDIFERVFQAAGSDMRRAIALFKAAGEAEDASRYLREWLAEHETSTVAAKAEPTSIP